MFQCMNVSGLFFNRELDNSVTITKTTDGMKPAEDESNVLFKQTLDDGAWCSVVSTVSVGGEQNLRWYIAMNFHNTADANGYTDPKYTPQVAE